MTRWSVNYRAKDGKQVTLEIEAEDRASVFAELAKRGIKAMRVSKSATLHRSSSSSKRGLIVGAIVVVAAIAAYFFIFREESKNGDEKSEKKSRVVREAPKKITPVRTQQATDEEAGRLSEKPKHYWERDTTNGLSEAQIRKWKFMHQPAPSYTNNTMATRPRAAYAIFPTWPENEIANLMTAEPGRGLVGTPVYGPKFEEEFLKSCETPIIVTDEDSEYQRQLKKDMVQMKIELRQRMSEGESLGRILLDARKELQRLAQIKRDVEAEVKTMMKESAHSEEDVDTFIEAANTMLQGKGISPIKINPITRRALMRSIKENP